MRPTTTRFSEMTDNDARTDTRRRRAIDFAIIFNLLLAFIGGVSAYDGYLVVRTGSAIREFEKNPVGLYLINFNHGDPSLFLRLKAAGTIVALSLLYVLKRHSQRLANHVTAAIVAFQAGLLFFLENPFS